MMGVRSCEMLTRISVKIIKYRTITPIMSADVFGAYFCYIFPIEIYG